MQNLNRETVLVLNRSWQAVHAHSAAQALSMMYTGTATGLDILGNDQMVPYKWDDWIKLPDDTNAKCVSTINGRIKIPTVIILCNFNRVPMKIPKFTMKGIWTRDGGICQYTGKKLSNNEGNIDHILPKSRGGKTTWTNCVLSHKSVNAKKANRTPEEAGLQLIKPPSVPRQLPITFYIRNNYNIPEWDLFLTYA